MTTTLTKKPKRKGRPAPLCPVLPLQRMGTLTTKEGLVVQVNVLGECSPCGRKRYDVQAVTGGPIRRVWASKVTLDAVRYYVLHHEPAGAFLASLDLGEDQKPLITMGGREVAMRYPEDQLPDLLALLGEGWKSEEATL